MKFENGQTNEVYKKGNEVVVKKVKNKFNHKINYQSLKIFNFVPKLISETKDEIRWEYIDGKMLMKPSDEDLKVIAKQLREVHVSDLKFPGTNLRKRVHEYLRIIHDKYIKDPDVDGPYREMMKLLKNMGHINPLHCDIWGSNIIKSKDNKIYFIDWEYAIMGDKHFDLAYYIESQRLNKKQEKIFLDEYNSHDDYQAYIPEWMDRYKKFVNWLALLWALAQDEIPFDLTYIRNRIHSL